ncbi:flagellin [Arcobacter sp. CECT 8989]|uniref:flagellin N-terminal helical domain-containing protein n=1 Tax=Arcobacter sp. CECT 8989 TaxID=2044509 RepID=UPI002159FF8A|nr:flagellin [Arcobacter sp. CECT 8989]
MRINTNVSSITAQESAVNTGKNIKNSLEKLSSGLRINKASDDASGLAIADKLRTQATSINQGVANGNSAVTLLQIADKSMAEQSNILDTVKSKLIQANTDTTSADGRESIRKDIVKLLEQLDNIAEQTNYNGNVLLQKSAEDTGVSSELSFQIGESKRDIISNTAVQSNTDGLGSQITYENGSELAQGETATLTSSSAITLKGTDSADANSIENVTLSGDVDSLTLTAGMTISGANADTKAVLDAAVTAGNLTEASGTYTVTDAGRNQSLDLSSVDDVSATVEISTSGNGGTTFDITSGQIIDTNTTAGVTNGSDLDTALKDASKFTETSTGSGIYVANTSISDLAIDTGDSVKITETPKDVAGGTGLAFEAGDTIEAVNVTTGSMLDNALNNSAMFNDNGDGTYSVKADFTAGNLILMDDESIKITEGTTPNFTTTNLTSGDFTISNGTIGGVSVIASTGAPEEVVAAGSGSDVFAGPDSVLTFDVAANATGVFNVAKDDIITFSDADAADGATANELSRDILESGKFLYLGGDKYQATESVDLHLTGGDSLTVEKRFGSGTETTVTGNGSTTETGAGSADADITFTTGGKVDVTNNDTTAGNKLSIEGTGITNGELQLSALADLKEGELTKQLADDFQKVVDDAITDLNGYRGDIGSTQNQVESAVRNLMTQATNVKAAESIIRDVDYAQESANFNKQNIISQAGSYAMSQANATQQNVLRLLQ